MHSSLAIRTTQNSVCCVTFLVARAGELKREMVAAVQKISGAALTGGAGEMIYAAGRLALNFLPTCGP